MSRPSPKKNKRRDRRKRRDVTKGGAPRRANLAIDADLSTPRPDLAHPPVFVDDAGTKAPDPYTLLGLDPDARVDPDRVQAAFRAAIAKTPPESDPSRARDLVEARRALLDPKLVMRRTLGDLRVPRVENFLPEHQSQTVAPPDDEPQIDWSSRSRLIAAASLFALLESEIENGETERATGGVAEGGTGPLF